MADKMVKINLNETVKVKLTDYGKDIFYHRYDLINQVYGKEIITPKMSKVDEEGYTTFQLHNFMYIFGNYMRMGCKNVIKPLEIIYGKDGDKSGEEN